MSEIIKAEAVVLSKMDFGDTSKIASFYTKESGKISGIIKGARSSNSKIGRIIDVMNYVHIVFYKKDSRDIQIVTQADLLSGYSQIKNDFNKLKYASAILELIQALIPEGEINEKVFKGLVKILSLIDSSNQQPGVLLLKFILFLLKETGFELQLYNCAFCSKELNSQEKVFFNFERGVLCNECAKDHLVSFTFSQELFNLFLCLRHKNIETLYVDKLIDNALVFLEKYIKYHLPEFKGINSIHIY